MEKQFDDASDNLDEIDIEINIDDEDFDKYFIFTNKTYQRPPLISDKINLQNFKINISNIFRVVKEL